MKKKNFKRFMAAAMSAVCLVTGTGGGYLAQAKEISDPTGLLEEEFPGEETAGSAPSEEESVSVQVLETESVIDEGAEQTSDEIQEQNSNEKNEVQEYVVVAKNEKGVSRS